MTDSTEVTLSFTAFDIDRWLRIICGCYDSVNNGERPNRVVFVFNQELLPESVLPIHLVTLACLTQFLCDRQIQVVIDDSNKQMSDYLHYDIGFDRYWNDKEDHVDALLSKNIFNLWRIVDHRKDMFANEVEQYLRRKYFAGKDLSAVHVSLSEAFYNVFDHANAGGNAFTLLQYDEVRRLLYVAVADFGEGIPTSVKSILKERHTDSEALSLSLQDNFTIRSTARNKGFGMGNILSCAKEARIFSNNALAVINGQEQEFHDISFFFPGTLLYFEVDLDSFEDEEILDDFTL